MRATDDRWIVTIDGQGHSFLHPWTADEIVSANRANGCTVDGPHRHVPCWMCDGTGVRQEVCNDGGCFGLPCRLCDGTGRYRETEPTAAATPERGAKMAIKLTPAERDATTQPQTLDSLQTLIGQWAEATFPTHTDDGIVRHIQEEVGELTATIKQSLTDTGVMVADIADDCADIAILVLTLANRCGFSLAAAIRDKHEVNKGRTWAHDAERDLVRHVEELS